MDSQISTLLQSMGDEFDFFDEDDSIYLQPKKGESIMDKTQEQRLMKIAEDAVETNRETRKMHDNMAKWAAINFDAINERLDKLSTMLRHPETIPDTPEMSEIEKDYRAKLANPFIDPVELSNHPFIKQSERAGA